MKQLHFLFSFLAVFLGLNVANAETVSPYQVDFDTSVDTSVKGFKAAPGWKHILGTNTYGSTPMAYSWSATTGVDGSGALYAGGQTTKTYDYLVTPAVSGTVTLDVSKQYSGGSTINFYAVTEEADGTLTVGDEIAYEGIPDVGAYNTLTLTVGEATRIAIKATYMYMDNFTAASADVVLSKEMTISRSGSTNWVYPNCDAEGNFMTNAYEITVTNTGEAALAPGDDGYSISMVKKDTTTPLFTIPVNENLAIGESTIITVPATSLAYADLFNEDNKSARLDFMENLSNTSITGDWYQPTPYISKFSFTPEGVSTEIESGTTVAFGKISETTTKTYAIRNSGAAPLQINSITAPAGYQLNVSGPLTVDASSSQPLTITLPATTPGYYAGALTISYKNNDNEDVEYTLALTGTVLDPSKWYATFDDENYPSGSSYSDSWDLAYSTDYTPTAHYIQSTTATTDLNLFVTPLLHADLNEVLQFDVARRGTGSGEDYHLGVYYSTDRENWTLIRNILNSELPETKAGSGYYNSSYAFETYAVNIPVEGNVYIGFSAGYVKLDNIYGLTLVPVDHDVLFTATLPTDGQTNHDLTIKTTAQNLLATAESDYTVKYYVDGVVAAEGEAVELTQGTKKNISFTYTPYMAGTYDTYAELEFIDGTKYTSDHVTLTVTEEQAIGETQIGTVASASSNIILTNYTSSETETVYTASELSLIPAGTEIKSLAWIGTRSATAADSHLQVYLQNTDDEAPAADGDVSAMKLVYDGIYTHPQVSKGKVIDLTLSEPFTYNGGNLRVFVRSVYNNGSGYPSATSYSCSSVLKTKYRRQDSVTTLTSSWSDVMGNPVIVLGYDKEASTFSGVLSIDNADNTNTPIVGATVTLTNGNTKYAGKTDAQGYYSFNVLQDDKTYNITTDYTAKNYFPQSQEETTVTFQGQSVVKNITLTEAVDFYLNGYEAPDKGKVGVEYTATATVTNYNKAVMEAGDYTATLYVGNLAVPATETVNLAEMEEHTFSFTFVPETDGVQTAYIQFAGPTRTIQTEEFTFTVEGVHGVTIAANLPTAGQVNHTVEAAATVTNNLDATEAADSYTIKYFVNGEAVSEATSVDLPKNSAKQFAFSFMPHATGSYTTYVELRFNDGLGTFKSEEVTLEIGSEIASAEKQVGEENSNDRNKGVIGAYYKKSQSETVYTAELLGFASGTKITSIAFKGYSGGYSLPLKVWVANTEDEVPVSSGTEAVSTDDMTLIYDGTYTIPSGGSANNYINLITLNLTTPITYTGNSLRVVALSDYTSYSSNTYFALDNTVTTQCVGRFNDSNLNGSFSAVDLPVTVFGYEKAPSVFTGVLSMNKADNTNTKIGGATVTLTAEDGVSYSGETGPDGRYTFPVIQDNKTYTVTVANLPTTLPAAFPLEKTITFNGQSIEENITLTEAVDFYLSNLDVPEAGMVNHDLTITIDVTNYGDAKAADDYTATLYFVGGEETEAVATAETVAIGEMETKTLTFHVTPYGAGTVPLYIELVTNNRSFKTDNFNVTIEEEFTGGEITVGTKNTTSGVAPTALYYGYSLVEMVYTAEQLKAFGAVEGSKVKKITFTATSTPTKAGYMAKLDAWVAPTSDKAGYTAGQYNTDEMTQVLSGDYDYNANIVNGAYTLTLDLSDSPIVFDGENGIRIVTSKYDGSYPGNISFPFDDHYKTTYTKQHDTKSTFDSNSLSLCNYGNPVAVFTFDNTNTISGVVTSDGTTPMANVKVIAQSDNVIYKTYTDDEGKYELVVCQTDKTYTLTASRNGEDTDPYVEEGLTFDNGDIVRDIVLGTYMLTLDESEFDGNLPSGLQGEAIVKYSAKAGWNTICEPFALTNEILTQIFGDEYKAYELVGGDNGVLTFTQPTAYVAGMPYVVFCKTPVVNENGLLVHGISIDAAQPQTVTYGGVTFQGTYAPIAAPGMEGLYGIVPTTGRIQKGSDKASLKGFRAYFEVSDGVDPANLSFSFDDGTIITGIDDATLMDNGLLTTDSAIYDLRGRKVAEAGHAIRLPKGVYIQNGKKITVK